QIKIAAGRAHIVATKDPADPARARVELEDPSRRELPDAARPYEHFRRRAAPRNARGPQELSGTEIQRADLGAAEEYGMVIGPEKARRPGDRPVPQRFHPVGIQRVDPPRLRPF